MVKRLTQLQKLALQFGVDDNEPIIEDDEPFEPESVAPSDVQVGGNPICNTSLMLS